MVYLLYLFTTWSEIDQKDFKRIEPLHFEVGDNFDNFQ